ncbi:bZIP transcription factor [Phascolarctid gammaherpesvirus 1]|uniref:BZIP transcription factor n=1 Tax=Phascolarctid gammaherpesvirus 1 TaxID=2249313 RepID=A0A3Q8J4I4_9GAMA|nr:bZIP transcription factor [Phascolarctid gammaherpesvirus 1]AZB49221.1 bZIP transcription factor [Phascolarctid gammaherpesvirus 1]
MDMLQCIKANEPNGNAIAATREVVKALLSDAEKGSRYMQGFTALFNMFNFWMFLKHLRNKNKPHGPCHCLMANYSTYALRLRMEDILINTDKAFIASACLGIPLGPTIAEYLKNILIHIRRKCIRQSRPLGTSRDIIMNSFRGIMDEYGRMNDLNLLDHKTKVMFLLLFPPINLEEEFRGLVNGDLDIDSDYEDSAKGFQSTTKKRGLRNRSKTGEQPERFPDPILLSGQSTNHKDIYATYCLKRGVEFITHLEGTAIQEGSPLPDVHEMMKQLQDKCVRVVCDEVLTSTPMPVKKRRHDGPSDQPSKKHHKTNIVVLDDDEEPSCSSSAAPAIDIGKIFTETVGEYHEPYEEMRDTTQLTIMPQPVHESTPPSGWAQLVHTDPQQLGISVMQVREGPSDSPIKWEIVGSTITAETAHADTSKSPDPPDPPQPTGQVYYNCPTTPRNSSQRSPPLARSPVYPKGNLAHLTALANMVQAQVRAASEGYHTPPRDTTGQPIIHPRSSPLSKQAVSVTQKQTADSPAASQNLMLFQPYHSPSSKRSPKSKEARSIPFTLTPPLTNRDPIEDLNDTIEKLKAEWYTDMSPAASNSPDNDPFPEPANIFCQSTSRSGTPTLLCSFSLSDFANK